MKKMLIVLLLVMIAGILCAQNYTLISSEAHNGIGFFEDEGIIIYEDKAYSAWGDWLDSPEALDMSFDGPISNYLSQLYYFGWKPGNIPNALEIFRNRSPKKPLEANTAWKFTFSIDGGTEEELIMLVRVYSNSTVSCYAFTKD